MKLRKVSWSTRQRRTCSSERKGEIGSHGGTVYTINFKPDRQSTYNVTLWRVRQTIVAVEKQYILHIVSVCLQPQVSNMQCACTLSSCVACLAPQHFSALSHKWCDF
jgi:hypothetical protein